MNWAEIILFIFCLLVMLSGLVGIILPFLPGIPIIFGASLLFALVTKFQYLSSDTIIIFAILTGVGLLLDWVATALGVKKFGGSIRGMIGAVLGMFAGLLIPGVNIAGFIIGSFIGAFLFEFLGGKTWRLSLRAGFGSFIGFIAGGVLRFVIGATMIGVFIWEIHL